MKKIVVLNEEEYHKIRESIEKIEDDIRDLDNPVERGIMFDDLNELSDLLGICD